MNATLKQAKKMLELIDQSGIESERFQKLIPYLSDLMHANVDAMNRNDFRKACGLKSVREKRIVQTKFRLRDVGMNREEMLANAISIGEEFAKKISTDGNGCYFSEACFPSDRNTQKPGDFVDRRDFSVFGELLIEDDGFYIQLKNYGRVYTEFIPAILLIADPVG